ncbi:ParB/RepB/Spo0J family partition protein [Albimonas sp. CAU 1670]|uniref:ParB/RepB/Spo0J family partition protein n=1 Tax=Albimonas sp. CAU 1670 TaxID=3032599 RepID=UPI0023DC1FD8|nr:ParB/RepB/Spo0J family partition protein [Albimonas sp. CAU 1670]MDF2231183.1 ParB/RepB/Spo0J family partition protein [Albimonas sp. CAU 1670]
MKRQQGRGLGRGLSALMGDLEETETAEGGAKAAAEAIAIDLIRPNPDQPRRRFGEEEIEELAASIREHGVIQPLILRPHPSGEGFEIVAGERRWRAAQRAQLHELPAVVRELDDATVLEFAIVENIQRSDLTPVEEARGYSRLIEEFNHTQERLGALVGKSRSHIANALRLLTLPISVLKHLEEGRLSAGHARALVVADDPAALAEQVIRRGLSVRETEALVRNAKAAGEVRKAPAAPRKDADTVALEADLSANLGMKVRIEHKGEKGGELRIAYADLDQLDKICQAITR